MNVLVWALIFLWELKIFKLRRHLNVNYKFGYSIYLARTNMCTLRFLKISNVSQIKSRVFSIVFNNRKVQWNFKIEIRKFLWEISDSNILLGWIFPKKV